MFRTSVSIKAVSIALLLLTLISSIGVSINIHYCGNAFKAIGVFAQAPSCEMVDASNCIAEQSCSDHGSFQSQCCSFDVVYNKLSPEVKLDMSVENVVLPMEVAFPQLVQDLRKFEAMKPELCLKDKVPKVTDNTVMYQCFLI